MMKLHIISVLFFAAAAAALAAAQRSPPSDPPPPPPASPYELARFNPSMAIIVVVIISAFFFMAFFFLYLRRCADDPASVRVGSVRGGLRSRRAAARGLDPAVVGTFPTFEYSVVKDLKLGKSTLECAVCLCEFDDDETLRLLPQCNHVFHPDCIDEWLRSHTTCPVCRANLAPGQPPVTSDITTAEDDIEAGIGSDEAPENIGVSDAVAIDVATDDTEAPPAAEQQRRPPRSRSMRRPKFAGKFPRSHSTGHSLVQPGENCDRYTLRLPENIRKEIIKGKLSRTGSSIGGGGGEGSSRGRSLRRWDRFARSDRWAFAMAAVPFFSRSFSSLASGSVGRGGEGGEQAAGGRSGRMFLTSVKSPFDCLTGAKSGDEQAESGAVQKSPRPVFTAAASP